MHFRPLHDLVVALHVVQDSRTLDGILIPYIAQEKRGQGNAPSVRSGRRDEKEYLAPQTVNADECIQFYKTLDIGDKVNGEELLMLAESDILRAVDGSPATLAFT